MLLDGWSNFCFVQNLLVMIKFCCFQIEFRILNLLQKIDLFVIFQVSILSKENRSLGSLQDIKNFAVLSPSQILKFNFHTQNIFG